MRTWIGANCEFEIPIPWAINLGQLWLALFFRPGNVQGIQVL